MTNLQQRILSGVGFSFLLLPLYFFKERAFIILGLSFCTLIFYELLLITSKQKFNGYKLIHFIFFISLSIAFILISHKFPIFTNVLASYVILLIITEVNLKKVIFKKKPALMTLKNLFLFAALPSVIVALCLSLKSQLHLLYLMSFLIVSTDVFGFFFGKKYGKRKLNNLSPKKTWEGFLLSLIPSTLILALFHYIYNLPFLYLLVFILVPVTSLLGDLHESLIKRKFNAKDSSQIIPGHGGFYDRFDSFILTLPFIFLLIKP